MHEAHASGRVGIPNRNRVGLRVRRRAGPREIGALVLSSATVIIKNRAHRDRLAVAKNRTADGKFSGLRLHLRPPVVSLFGEKHARISAALDLVNLAVRARSVVGNGICYSEPKTFGLEMMPEMVFLDPASEARARLKRDVRHVMDPLVVEQTQEVPENERADDDEVMGKEPIR